MISPLHSFIDIGITYQTKCEKKQKKIVNEEVQAAEEITRRKHPAAAIEYAKVLLFTFQQEREDYEKISHSLCSRGCSIYLLDF